VIPLGYDLDTDGCLVPSMRHIEAVGMTEAQLVRDLFQRIAQGSTSLAECHRLNALGVVTARSYGNGKVVDIGALWRPSRLNKVLKNTVYAGVHALKSHRGDIARIVPPLVEQATWDAV